MAVAGGGGEEVADILITVEKRRPERYLFGLVSLGVENLEMGFTNAISAAIEGVAEARERL